MAGTKKRDDLPRIPHAYGGIQVNFCKNPACANFGVEPGLKGTKHAQPGVGSYRLSGTAKSFTALVCNLCGEMPPLKSNQAVNEEILRISASQVTKQISCPDVNCTNHDVPVEVGKSAYSSYGKSTGDSKRYLCKVCSKTFSVRTKATIRQRIPEKNAEILRLLMNKVVMRRICEIARINPAVLYNKIEFFKSCATALTAHYEKPLRSGEMPIKRLYLSSDRQEYILNWKRQTDRRNIMMTAIGTADNDSGYIFSMNLNFDPNCNPEEIEKDAIKSDDYNKPVAHRKYARLWLNGDYKESVKKSAQRKNKGRSDLPNDIEQSYLDANDRIDVERSEQLTLNDQLPDTGMQVHSEYTLYAHFYYLKNLFSFVEKVRFFVDQDSPMRSGAINGFTDWIKQRKADIFFVRLTKELSINEKRGFVKQSKTALMQAQLNNPGLSDKQVEIEIIKENIKNMPAIGKWKDRWLIMPFPKMNEPQKAICHLTDFKDYDPDHLAHLYRKASLHGIDRFFMLVRRRISLLERPIATASSGGRNWTGGSAYNPVHIANILDIFRTYYNYCIVGDGAKETAAMRFGLCDHQVTDEEFLSFFQP